GTTGLAPRQMAQNRDRAGRKILFAHPRRPRTAGQGAGAMGAALWRRRACHPNGGGVSDMHLQRWLDIVRMRLRSLLRRNNVERELDRELRFHLDQEIEANIHRGLAPAEARSAALRHLGGVVQIQEECRDARRTSYVESFLRDL